MRSRTILLLGYNEENHAASIFPRAFLIDPENPLVQQWPPIQAAITEMLGDRHWTVLQPLLLGQHIDVIIIQLQPSSQKTICYAKPPVNRTRNSKHSNKSRSHSNSKSDRPGSSFVILHTWRLCLLAGWFSIFHNRRKGMLLYTDSN